MLDIENEFGTFTGFVKNLFCGQTPELPQQAGLSDWESLLSALSRHGLQPLFQYLCEVRDVILPEGVAAVLRNSRKQQVIFDLLENAKLEELREACQGADIPLLLLKGTPLAHQIYPAAGLRPRCDTDLMIRREDWTRFHKVALEVGLEAPESIEPKLVLEVTYVWPTRLGIALALDVHRELSNSRLIAGKVSFDELYRNGQPVRDFGDGVRMLSPVYALYHACFHRAVTLAGVDARERLIWLYDIALLWRMMSAPERAELVALATRLRTAVLCQSALRACSDWFDLPIEEGVRRQLEQTGPGERPAKRLLDERFRSRQQAFVTDVLAHDGLRNRFEFVKDTLFPEACYMRYRYPGKSPLVWLYIRRLADGAVHFLRRSL